MKYHKIVLAGGNSYLGGVLAKYFKDKCADVVLLSRRPATADGNIRTVVWDGRTPGDWAAELEGTDLLVNLCGKNVNCRYTPTNRAELISSRTVPTALLGTVIGGLKNAPQLWINLASATIYRHAEDRPQDEETGEIGYGFSIDICKEWEQTFFDAHTPHTRKIALRQSLALGRADGVFPRLLNLVKAGLGGKQGDGEQYVSWLHEHDFARIVEYVMHRPELDGVINCTAPEAVKNNELMQIIRDAYGVPIGLPAPQWLLEIGAAVIRTETELILKSRWVAPKRLLDSGFVFTFPKAAHAIHDILSLRV